LIGIVDYGAGNLASVFNAFENIGYDAHICSDPKKAFEFERLILPGVGSFRSAMESLVNTGWSEALKNYVQTGQPMLGICLGMQLLFSHGEEDGSTNGLDLISGSVIHLTPSVPNKVPHVGWNNLVTIQSHPLFKGVKPQVDFYFVHSYHCVPNNIEHIIANCDYGGEFASCVANENVVGMQFHPEKSQPSGMRLLENFAEWDPLC
jgi:imidazole glycerol-phosphate synthase subunit HisH